MLLSTDWFAPYWGVLGIELDAPKRNCIQEGAREIVKRFMSGSNDYWLIDYSEERIRETRQRLDDLLSRCSVGLMATERIVDIVSGDDDRYHAIVRKHRAVTGLLASITEGFLDTTTASGVSLRPEVRAVVRRTWQGVPDLEELCLSSPSVWDGYVRSLTPGLPTWLSDYASLLGADQSFGVFWTDLKGQLTRDEIAAVARWYRETALGLTGEEIGPEPLG